MLGAFSGQGHAQIDQTPASFGAFIALLFVGTLSTSLVMPFVGFHMVDGLGQPPWMLSVYAGIAAILTVTANRAFGRRIDGGARVFPLVGLAAGAFVAASLAMTLSPGLAVLLSLGVLGYGVSNSAVSTMFSLGGHIAGHRGMNRQRANAIMRATCSAAWMIGPAASFTLAGQFGNGTVFRAALALGLAWLALWALTLPRDITAPAPRPVEGLVLPPDGGLWLAAGFVFCLSVAHGLTATALPLFFTQEVGLPDFAPGAAFSVKTFVEILAIFTTPWLIARFGLRKPLMAVSLLAVVAILVLAQVTNLAQMALGSALEGLYYGLFASLGISYIQSFDTARPAQATAIYWNTLMLSSMLSMPAMGLIAQVSDFRTAILIGAGVAALSAPVLLLGIRAREARA